MPINSSDDDKTIELAEAILLKEIAAKDFETFMYKLNRCGIFDEEKFDSLIRTANIYFHKHSTTRKTDNFPKIARGLLNIFQHTIFLFYCNESSEDQFEIQNWKNAGNIDIVTRTYSAIRQVSQSIIS